MKYWELIVRLPCTRVMLTSRCTIKILFVSEYLMFKLIKIPLIVAICLMIQGCIGTIVGTTADVAIEVAKIPFKVAGAVVDVASGDGSKKKKKSDDGGDD